LPEAFGFADLIPAVAGIAGTVLTGNPLIGAAAAGATSAGKTAIEGGSAQDALISGLVSGATTFAGGQLLSGVGDAAAKAAGATAAEAAGTTAGSAGMAKVAGDTALSSVAPAVSPGIMGQLTSNASGLGTTLSNIASEPGAALSQLGSNIQARPFSALIAGGGMLNQANNMFGRPSMSGEEDYDPNRYPEQFPDRPRTFTAPPVGYVPGRSPEFRYFAEGGLASLRQENGYTANLVNEAKAALLGEHPRPREAIMRFQEAFGEDALNVLRDRISGGRVRGAGGGMDDLVPGSIEGRQKVRLADGEFVIPSDVVSGLGDGSTDQGVRKLHGLMDNVRQQRTGRKAQPMSIGGKITL
jgi:hypothetical protein